MSHMEFLLSYVCKLPDLQQYIQHVDTTQPVDTGYCIRTYDSIDRDHGPSQIAKGATSFFVVINYIYSAELPRNYSAVQDNSTAL